MEGEIKKTLLVGLDAACWEYLSPLLQTDRMPTLQRLIETGSWGILKSTMPPWTPTAWASIITGKNPGKHGVFDMLWRQPGSYEFTPTNAKVRMGTPFWKRLNEAGIRVGLVNVPFTYPGDPLDGFFVAGFGTPGSASQIAYPLEILPWMERKFGGYQPEVPPEALRTLSPPAIFDMEREHQARQVCIATELAKKYEVDVLVINLMFTDHANHKMPTMDQVHEAYCRTDEDLNLLLHEFCPDRILLVSDHGSCRLKGDFLLNVWLRGHGYYVHAKRSPSERSAALNWILLQWLQGHHGWLGMMENISRRLLRQLLLNLPDRMTKPFWRRINQIIPFAHEHTIWKDEPDYSRSKLFPGSVYSGLLYFNLVNRDPAGVVSVEESNNLAIEIAEKLSQVEDPDTGRPLFMNVYKSNELYVGDAVEAAPDLVLDSYAAGWNVRTGEITPAPRLVRNRYFIDALQRGEFGWHARNGIFIFSGEEFAPGSASCEASVMDIPATLLHFYGIPIPEDYDGRVLTELIKPEFLQQPIHFQAGDAPAPAAIDNPYSTAESAELIDHLRALGYLD